VVGLVEAIIYDACSRAISTAVDEGHGTGELPVVLANAFWRVVEDDAAGEGGDETGAGTGEGGRGVRALGGWVEGRGLAMERSG
jgi:hypothetical protein